MNSDQMCLTEIKFLEFYFYMCIAWPCMTSIIALNVLDFFLVAIENKLLNIGVFGLHFSGKNND